ncbi:hypothetical protein D3C87_1536800 [compost metagenome]
MVDHLAYFLGGLLGARGQGAHLIGHDCKPSSGLTGTGRLDGCIEGEQIGLVSDAGDDRHNGFNALTEGGQVIDRMTGGVHLLGQALDGPGRAGNQSDAVGGFFVSRDGRFGSGLRVARDILGGRGHLGHGGGQLIQFLQLHLYAVGGLIRFA